MSALPGDDSARFAYDRGVVAAFGRLTGGFWKGPGAGSAWFWTIGLATSLAATVGVNVAVNAWNGWFFNSLEAKDAQAVGLATLVFLGLTVVVAAVGVLTVITRETLQVRWREWVTRKLVGLWFHRQGYYRLGLTGSEPANPEYRIADDTRLALEPIVDFAIGFFSATIGALTFIGILWSIGGGFRVESLGLTIPAYLVLAALVHGIVASGLMFVIGHSLMRKIGARNEAEAKLRFGLMRVRENAQHIALGRGEADESRGIDSIYTMLVRRWLAVVQQNGRLTWITNGNGALIPVVPLLLAAPKYLSGDLSLGQVTQLAAAYIQVQIAISWFVDNYRRVAECYASVRRVVDLTEALDLLDVDEAARGDAAIVVHAGHHADLRLEGLVVHDRSGRVLIQRMDAVVKPGEWLLIAGESGSGKSMLVRALAGLWPWGEGEVHLPDHAEIAFLSQRPHIPEGTLREALLYPHGRRAVSDEELASALVRCGLGTLVTRLDEETRWDNTLSDGERQRLAIARLLISRPQIVILDDATGAVERQAEIMLLEALRHAVPEAAVITVARHEGLEPLHHRTWTLRRAPEGSWLDMGGIPEPVPPAPARRRARTAKAN